MLVMGNGDLPVKDRTDYIEIPASMVFRNGAVDELVSFIYPRLEYCQKPTETPHVAERG